MKEIELKLSLPDANTLPLQQQLDGWAPNRGTQTLHNMYFDTPDYVLHGRRIALRIRHQTQADGVQWIQTLKVGGGDAALSQRGEWEVTITKPELSYAALQDTPWAQWDPDGAVFARLIPCFTTEFARTTWMISLPEGAMEVALDIGAVQAGTLRHPIAELECELRSGSATALYVLAEQLAVHIALLPSNWSKAQRGFGLAQQTLQSARSRKDDRTVAVNVRAHQVLNDAFSQFTTNLNSMLHAQSESLLRQCWLGLRRWRAACQIMARVSSIVPPWMPIWYEVSSQVYALLRSEQSDAAHQLTLDTLRRPAAGQELVRTSRWLVLGE
jgi:inorganic triphosphatase YgiF